MDSEDLIPLAQHDRFSAVTLLVQKETTGDQLAEAISRRHPSDVEVEKEGGPNIFWKKLEELSRAHRHVVLLADEPYAQYLNRLAHDANSTTRFRVDPVSEQVLDEYGGQSAEHKVEHYCVGLRDNCPQLLWHLNTVLLEMERDGTTRAIRLHYEGQCNPDARLLPWSPSNGDPGTPKG